MNTMTTDSATPTEKTMPNNGHVLRIDLGLQGGGAHGAFTWGVLDRLLEETWLRSRGSPAHQPAR